MSTGISTFNLQEAHRTLVDNPATMPWLQRRELVAEAVAQYKGNELAVYELFSLLADDDKWEVRKAVAENLHILSDSQIPHIASKLTNDTNDYVKNAAERSIARKRKVKAGDAIVQDVLLCHSERLDQLQKIYGLEARKTALEIAQEQCNIFAGSVAHDLLNILTPLRSEIEAAIENAKASDIFGHLTNIKDNFEFLRQTVGNIEDLAKELPDEKYMENVSGLLAEAIQKAQQNITALGFDISKVHLNFDCPEDFKLLVCRQSLISAFVNIIKNAYESFMTDGNQMQEGVIDIFIRNENQKLKIKVIDNGMGICEQEIKRLATFIPGRRNKSKPKSTGYGLPLAKRYIEKHDGEIFIESKDDQGTEITIILPQYVDEGSDDKTIYIDNRG